jgi:hypothetical protein
MGPLTQKKQHLKRGGTLALYRCLWNVPGGKAKKCFGLKGIMYGCVFVVCLFVLCFLRVLSEREVINKETVIWPVIKRRNSNPTFFSKR